MFCLSLTGDVVGVVKAVAVEFARLSLFSWGTSFLLSRLAKQVSSPLPSTVSTAWLRSKRETMSFPSTHMKTNQALLMSLSPVKSNAVYKISPNIFKDFLLCAHSYYSGVKGIA